MFPAPGINQGEVRRLKTGIQRLGGKVTEVPQTCSHIVAQRVTRTIKFLTGISLCDHIVTLEWVEQSLRAGHFLEEVSFALHDPTTESLFQMDVSTSLGEGCTVCDHEMGISS